MSIRPNSVEMKNLLWKIAKKALVQKFPTNSWQIIFLSGGSVWKVDLVHYTRRCFRNFALALIKKLKNAK